MKCVFRNVLLALIFGAIYCGIEILFRGYSDLSMAIVGGISGIVIGGLNNYLPWEMPVLVQCGIGCGAITIFEGLSGVILNIWLGLNIWDYSNMWGQFFWGQCCVPFCICWFFLAGAAIFLDDWLRWLLFDEDPPHYRWI